jgi:hypothetical protein
MQLQNELSGGAGKLLKYFEQNYKPKSIITYADRAYSQGNMYFKLEFKFIKNNVPSYNWIKDNIILSRFQCQKSKLKEMFKDRYNEYLSENENMLFNGFSKLYDCGNIVFEKIYTYY